MKIAVLCGGISSEREISLRSSSKVAAALQSKGHSVVMLDLFFGEESIPDFDGEKDFFKKAGDLRKKNCLITEELVKETGLCGPNVVETCALADIVFLGLHGENGEDGKIQALFDKEKIKYTGSGALSSALAMSKEKTKEIVSPHIRMPKGFIVKKGEAVPGNIQVPCVIKPSNGGSSIGVLIVTNDGDFGRALEEGLKYDDTVLVEEYIKGRELTQAVIDGKPYPPVEIISDADEWYDYENKYSGKTKEICPAGIPEEVLKEMSETSVKFGNLLGLGVYYRIDYLLDGEGRLYALEANSLPGMTDTSLVPQEAKAEGIDYPELCEMIINISLAKYDEA